MLLSDLSFNLVFYDIFLITHFLLRVQTLITVPFSCSFQPFRIFCIICYCLVVMDTFSEIIFIVYIGIGSNPVLRRRSETSDPSGFKTENQSRHKRWSDLHLTDMVFTNEGIQPKRSTTDRDSWKRWSDLQLKQDQKLLTQIKVRASSHITLCRGVVSNSW